MNLVCKNFVALLALAIIMPGSPAMAEGRSVSDVLGQIDKELRGIRGVTATVTITKMVSGQQDTVSAGSFFSNRNDDVRIDFTSPAARTVLIKENSFSDYSPEAKTADKWSISNAPEGELRFLNLGFGDTGSDLDRDFIVTVLESASWNGRQTTALALTPKQDYRRAQAWSIVLRLDELSWLPVQQIIWYGNSQTYLRVDYTDMAKNNNLKTKTFKPDWPSGTKTTSH